MNKKVIVDIETTGLNSLYDEILQISIIDSSGYVLMNKYCKPENLYTWEDAEKIHGITPEMVKNEQPFRDFIEKVSDILINASKIIIYNANFELSFFDRYGVKYNNNVYDLMEEFAEIYGQWNDYYCNYTWQPLSTCCLYYGYELKNAHNSLEDCKATLYCYSKLINNEGRYDGSEYIGKTFKEFLNEAWKKVDNKSISLRVYPVAGKRNKYYFYNKITTYDDVKYQELLDSKIHAIRYNSPRNFSVWVDRCLSGDFDLLQKEAEILKEKNSQLEKENDELRKARYENYSLYIEENKKVIKLEKKINKIKEKLGLIIKEEKKIPMLNSYGFYTAEYCRSTRKPMFKSRKEYEPFADKLLSKSRCEKIKMPIKENEEIYGFYKVQNGYCALYFRNIETR